MDEIDKDKKNKNIGIDDENKDSFEENKEGNYLALGICLGMCLGITVGYLFFENIGIGIGFGMCLGPSIGLIIKNKNKWY